MPQVASLITFGLGGHTVHWVPKWDERGHVTTTSRTSGYDDPVRFVQEVAEGKYPDAYWRDGVPVVDLRAVAKHNPGGVVNMPMVEPGTWKADPFGRELVEAMALMRPGLSGGFDALADRKLRQPQWKGLDKVPTMEYLAVARDLGCRTGVFDGHNLVWDDEA